MPKKILLIEDEESVAQLYKMALEQADYRISLAKDGRKGLEIAKEGTFDLILLDIMLPEMSGLDVLKELKLDPNTSKSPVYMLTVLEQNEIITNAFELGAEGYLIKAAFPPSGIVNEVKKALEVLGDRRKKGELL